MGVIQFLDVTWVTLTLLVPLWILLHPVTAILALVIFVFVREYTVGAYFKENGDRIREEVIHEGLDYFSFDATKSVEEILSYAPTGKDKVLYTIAPHGILCEGGFLIAPYIYGKIVPLCNRWLLKLPLVGDFLRHITGAQPLTSKHLHHLMSKNRNVMFYVGGFQEATLTNNDKNVFYAHNISFAKYAKKYDYTVVPLYVFGENKTYSVTNVFEDLRMWFAKRGIPCNVLFWGKWGLPIPHSVPIRVVCGEPFKFESADPAVNRKLWIEHVLRTYAKGATEEDGPLCVYQ
eukprot:Colp12_sorted_trinity150504_noHs@394